MQTVEIQVGLKSEKVLVPYSPRDLVAQPFSVSHEAVQVAELQWIQLNLAGSVREEVSQLYRTASGPFSTLDDVRSSDLQITVVAMCDGQVSWEMELICDECDGSGETTTIRGTEVVCPTCAGAGSTSAFNFLTNIYGRFIGYEGAGVKNLRNSLRSDLPSFDALPLDEALAITEREWS